EGKGTPPPPPPPPAPTIAPSFWQLSAIYGIGASEIMGTDPSGGSGGNGVNGVSAAFPTAQGFTGGTAFAGYNFSRFAGNINNDGTVNSGSLRRASKFRATAQAGWNVSQNLSIGAAAYYEYD